MAFPQPINYIHRKYDSFREPYRFLIFMCILPLLCAPDFIQTRWLAAVLMAIPLWLGVTRVMYLKGVKQ